MNSHSARKTLALAVIIAGTTFLQACQKQNNYDAAINNPSRSLLELHNSTRTNGQACPFQVTKTALSLKWNQTLAEIARAHSVDMSGQQTLSHEDSSGFTLAQRLNQSGYAWQTYAENIAFGVSSGQEALELWLNSQQHCKNLMNQRFDEMGSANVNGYWTAIYAQANKR